MRVLVVTNLMPDASAPQRGRWIQDQVKEIRRAGVEVELFGFPPGRGNYVPATRRLRRLLRIRALTWSTPTTGWPGGAPGWPAPARS